MDDPLSCDISALMFTWPAVAMVVQRRCEKRFAQGDDLSDFVRFAICGVALGQTGPECMQSCYSYCTQLRQVLFSQQPALQHARDKRAA